MGDEDATWILKDDARAARTNRVNCPPCKGTGQTGGRPCVLCAGAGELSTDVAGDPDDAEDIEVEPPGERPDG